jgi:glycosyltransferase involved in cell wall biosynthesis
MLTTVGDRCGIAAYSRALVAAMQEFVEVEVEPIQVGKQPIEHYQQQAERLNRADVVHVQHEHSFWGGILPNQSAFWNLRYLIRKPFVITAHTTYSLAELLKVKQERRPLQRLAKEILLRRRGYRDSVDIAPFATKGECIVHTEGGRAALLSRGASASHVHVVPAGVPEPLNGLLSSAETIASFREKFGLGARRIISLFGYIAPNKGYELTLEILPRLPQEAVFVIAGGVRVAHEESYADSLRARIAERGLTDRVVVTGFLSEEEVATAMAASEVVVVPHTFATGSYSVTIPLSYGKPIVASDLDCFTEIEARVSCLKLFTSGDAARYAEALKGLLADPSEQRRLSQGAKEYAARHSWREIARRTLDLYRQAICETQR